MIEDVELFQQLSQLVIDTKEYTVDHEVAAMHAPT